LGYAPPLAWDEDAIDDPTATPHGADDPMNEGADVVDLTAVRRAATGGDPSRVQLSPAERIAVVRSMAAAGASDAEIAGRLGVVSRTALRLRQDQEIPAGQPRPRPSARPAEAGTNLEETQGATVVAGVGHGVSAAGRELARGRGGGTASRPHDGPGQRHRPPRTRPRRPSLQRRSHAGARKRDADGTAGRSSSMTPAAHSVAAELRKRILAALTRDTGQARSSQALVQDLEWELRVDRERRVDDLNQDLRRCVVVRALLSAAADTSTPPHSLTAICARRRFLAAALEVVDDLLAIETAAARTVLRLASDGGR